jgi:hypothetical protein
VAVAAARKKKSKAGSGWSWRLAGIALCAFFALGVLTGLSPSGRLLARRIGTLLSLFRASRSELIPDADEFLRRPPAFRLHSPGGAVALVEHGSGFYQLDSQGALRGPISPARAADLPILSGAAVESATPAQLLGYAGELVRGEAALSLIISEMQVEADGDATLFLERPRIAIAIAPGHVPLELARAGRILALWRAHRALIATIDMRTPGQAIVRLGADIASDTDPLSRPGARGVKHARTRAIVLPERGPEVTASK